VNVNALLKYGHAFILEAVEGIPEQEWETPDVCGIWSCKEIIAHLASFEHVLVEVLGEILGQSGEMPLTKLVISDGEAFNDQEVGRRSDLSWSEALAEYNEVHAQTLQMIGGISETAIQRPGTVPGYGDEYALDDFIVYSFYGHKREHGAQINVFRDLLAKRH